MFDLAMKELTSLVNILPVFICITFIMNLICELLFGHK